MKLLLVTSMVTHHQLPLAQCLVKSLGDESLRYVATDAMNQGLRAERRRMGWNDAVDEPWILRSGENAADNEEFRKWWLEADIVLTGLRDVGLMRERLERGGVTFHMSERFWKPPLGRGRLLYPGYLAMALAYRRLARSKAFHFLAIGPYAATDMKAFAAMGGGMWSWGYFPPEASEPMIQSRELGGFRIMWAGRMLAWKRVATLVRAFRALKNVEPKGTLTLIGDGPERGALERLSATLGLQGSVRFLGSMKAEQVRLEMRVADVFVLCSGPEEGWGAVVNEAMAEGCAVVGTYEAGASAALIRSGQNGFLFRSGSEKELADILLGLCRNAEKRKEVAEEGKRCVEGEWSPRTAAKRLVELAHATQGAGPMPEYRSGPMVRLAP